MLPTPGGGMSVDRAADMAAMYGDDVVYLLGGSILREGDRIGDAVAAMRRALDEAAGA
jgi:ribulose-bisphosphate carboxylase large chain